MEVTANLRPSRRRVIPASCNRSQIASTSGRLLENARPPSAFTFESHRLTRANQLLPRLDRIIAVEKACMARSRRPSIRRDIHCGARAAQRHIARDPNPASRERRPLF